MPSLVSTIWGIRKTDFNKSSRNPTKLKIRKFKIRSKYIMGLSSSAVSSTKILEYSTRLDKKYSTRIYSSIDFPARALLDSTRLENWLLASTRKYSKAGKMVHYEKKLRKFLAISVNLSMKLIKTSNYKRLWCKHCHCICG